MCVVKFYSEFLFDQVTEYYNCKIKVHGSSTFNLIPYCNMESYFVNLYLCNHMLSKLQIGYIHDRNSHLNQELDKNLLL